MKKLLCALLALAMLCACAAAEEADVTGTWYLNEIKLGEERINPAAMNLELAFTLNENGAFIDGDDLRPLSGRWRGWRKRIPARNRSRARGKCAATA